MAILTAVVGTGDCFGSTIISTALAVDADAFPSNAGIFSSATAEAATLLSSESSSSSSSAVIESSPPSAIGGKALVLPDGATSDDSSSPTDVDTDVGKKDLEIPEEVLQSADAAPTTSETSPILSSTETAAVSANSDIEDKSDMTMTIQIQEEETPAVVTAEQQSSAVAKSIDKGNNKNYDYDDISLSVLSQLGNSKNTAAVSETLENISLLVAPAAIVAVLALLASPSTVQEDAGSGEDTNNNNMSDALKGTNAIIDGKKASEGSRKEWKSNAPIPYGLQEGTPKWSSLPPPPPSPKKKQSESVAPLFAVSPSSSPPTLALKQPKKTIDRGSFRSSTTTTSFGKSTIVNDLSSPSSQAIKLPQKGAISTSGSSMPSSSTSFTKQQQPQKGKFVAPTTTSTTDASPSIPKSFAKSAYKKSSLNKMGQQQPLPYTTPSVAAASSGDGNAKAAPGSSSDESGSEMTGSGLTKEQRGDDGGENQVAGWPGTVAKGTSTIRPATAPQPPMTTFVGGETRDTNTLKGAMSAPAGIISNIRKTASSSSSSSDRAGIAPPAISTTTAPKSYAKSSYKKSSTNTEQSTPTNNFPAPATTFATEPTSEGSIRNEGMVRNEISAGGMLKGQKIVDGSSLKSYSKSSFKSNNIGATAPSGIPGGGYLTDLSDIPLSPTGSTSSIIEAPLAAVSKGETVASAVYFETTNKSNSRAGGSSGGGSGGDGILKGATGDADAGMERISPPLFGKGPSMRFGGGVKSFKKGGGTVFGGSTRITDSPKKSEFLSDLVQAKVPSNVSPSSSSPTSSDQPTDISPSQLASMIPRTSSTPTSPAAIQAAKSRLLQDVPMTTVRIGSATRMGSLTAIGNASQGNTNQRGWNPVLKEERGADEPMAGSRSIEQQRPQSVTITDPRTGKKRTISISDMSAPE